jgi:hypothetical protein
MDSAVRWQAASSSPTRSDPAGETAPDTELPVLPGGVALEPSGVYLDLSHPARGPFRALPGQVAGSGNRYVAQRDVSCETWCDLVRAASLAALDGQHEVDCSILHEEPPLVVCPRAAESPPDTIAAP